ncbi:MAG TPA: EF-hand domain-containing protein [Usitatibacter sp.]|nr:EF-hand domain-containing protein [Usitatibacter sp.]
MKHVATLTALALASAAVIAIAAPEGGAGKRHHGGGMERLKQADTDGNGMISRDEAKALPRIAQRFDEIDANKDNQLSPDELRAFHAKMHAARGAERFKRLDTDGDGKVSLAEAKAHAPRLAEHFSKVDANGDGFITPEEMKAAHAAHARK